MSPAAPQSRGTAGPDIFTQTENTNEHESKSYGNARHDNGPVGPES